LLKPLFFKAAYNKIVNLFFSKLTEVEQCIPHCRERRRKNSQSKNITLCGDGALCNVTLVVRHYLHTVRHYSRLASRTRPYLKNGASISIRATYFHEYGRPAWSVTTYGADAGAARELGVVRKGVGRG
jgi:hypothetical protein